MADRKAIKRLLERLGFVHIAGWVRKEDAPPIRRKIEAAKEEVEWFRRTARAEAEVDMLPSERNGSGT